jgi:hypothetical protein
MKSEMTRNPFKNFFPMRDSTGVMGAYSFLKKHGYKAQSDRIRHEDNNKEGFHRQMLVALLFDRQAEYQARTKESLMDEFLVQCWGDRHAPRDFRLAKLEEWRTQYQAKYAKRFGSLLQ